MNKTDTYTDYELKMHGLGKFWTAVMIFVMLCIPAGICIIFKTLPNFSNAFWMAFLPILLMDIPSGLIELITYAPFLGTGGTYLGFITGNLSNLKVPCVMNAREMTKVEIGSVENEVVSTISIAVSAITTTVVLVIGVLLIVPLAPILENPALTPAFKTVIPAMFGALGYKYASSSPQVAIIPMILAITVFLVVPTLTYSVSIMVFVIAFVSLASAFLLYKKGIIK